MTGIKRSSAQKMTVKIEKRTIRNRSLRSRCRTLLKDFERSLVSEDKVLVVKKLQLAEKALRKGVSKGIFRLKTVSRKISRISARAKKIAGGFVS